MCRSAGNYGTAQIPSTAAVRAPEHRRRQRPVKPGICSTISSLPEYGLPTAHFRTRRDPRVRTSPNRTHTGGVEPGGDARWDEPPLDVVIPDDARELEREVIAYHRELRALRRRRRLRRLLPAHAGIMPLIASILAVCLVAGMMLSVFTISPVDSNPGKAHTPRYGTSQPSGTGSATPPRAPASSQPSGQPGNRSSSQPSGQPTGQRSSQPGNQRSGRPSASPREHATA